MTDRPTINVSGTPFGIAEIVKATLANPLCSSDHLLWLADAIDQIAREALPANSPYVDPCKRLATDLRDAAPHYANPPAAT